MVSNGSKIKLVTLNLKCGESAFRRSEIRISHSFNIFRPTTLMMLDGDKELLIQDKANQTLMFSLAGRSD